MAEARLDLLQLPEDLLVSHILSGSSARQACRELRHVLDSSRTTLRLRPKHLSGALTQATDALRPVYRKRRVKAAPRRPRPPPSLPPTYILPGLAAYLSRMPQLRALDATLCPAGVLRTLALPSLTSLTLQAMGGLTCVAPLAACTNLVRLDLRRNGGVSDLTPLGGCAALEALFLCCRRYIDVQEDEVESMDLSPLTRLTRLRVLDLGRRRLASLQPLGALVALTHLDLLSALCGGAPIACIAPLSTCTRLRTLCLREADIRATAALAPAGGGGGCRLTQLDVGGLRRSWRAPAGLSALTHLSTLRIQVPPGDDDAAASSPAESSALAACARLPALTALHLDCRADPADALLHIPGTVTSLTLSLASWVNTLGPRGEGLRRLRALKVEQESTRMFVGRLSLDLLLPCAGLRNLDIGDVCGPCDTSALRQLPHLTSLRLGLLLLDLGSPHEAQESLQTCAAMAGLRALLLRSPVPRRHPLLNAPPLVSVDVSPLAACPSLTSLSLGHSLGRVDVAPLAACRFAILQDTDD